MYKMFTLRVKALVLRERTMKCGVDRPGQQIEARFSPTDAYFGANRCEIRGCRVPFALNLMRTADFAAARASTPMRCKIKK